MISEREKKRITSLFLSGCKKSNTPLFTVIGGGIGSGKSTFYKKSKIMGVHHDPDAVLNQIKGYQDDTKSGIAEDIRKAFAKWELPARELSEEILDQALNQKFDIVYSRTCSTDETPQFLKDVKGKGYKIIFNGIYADLKMCLERAQRRMKIENRYSPPEVVTERHQKFLKLLPLYKEIADDFYFYQSFGNEVFKKSDHADYLTIVK